MGSTLILVVGPSGVGKSTLCDLFVQQSESAVHLQASSFVKHGGEPDPDQTGLTAAIRREVDGRPEAVALVDGHLVIRGKRIPLEAIRILAPSGLIVVTDDPAEIVQRRLAVRPAEDADQIEEEQADEVAFARELSVELDVPVLVVDEASMERFAAAVKQIVITAAA